MKYKYKVLIIILMLLIFNSLTYSQSYKEYKYSRKQIDYFEITFDKKYLSVRTFDEEQDNYFKYIRPSIKLTDGLVYADGKLLFDEKGLVIDDISYPYSDITDCRIMEKDNKVTITFLTGDTKQTRTKRFKKGNIISFDEDIVIDEGDFIRGMVFSVAGDIEIFGEVNKDVIALTGDIHVGPEATVRGDIASAKGKVSLSKKANVYGEVNYISRKRLTKRHHRFAWKKSVTYDNFCMDYNRVDGLKLFNEFNYKDPDSLIPLLNLKIGYAFASERWRYNIGVEQVLLRTPALTAGGSFYRELSSEDNWIMDKTENMVFALLFTEDFKDYYESEGARAFLRFKSKPNNIFFETGYNYRNTKFLRAHRHLWSLFGGSKLFPENYSTFEPTFRASSINSLDSATNASWYNKFDYSTISKKDPFDYSGWHFTADYEHSHTSLNSDYDYHRYMLNLRRYQTINRYLSLIIRGVYGGSDGFLPMEKMFTLGGPGTLNGYHNKEYTGTEFWLLNSEYRMSYPKSDITFSVFWDAGRIADDVKLSTAEIKNDIGAAVQIGDAFKISLSKRLDRGYNDDPIIYARFKHTF